MHNGPTIAEVPGDVKYLLKGNQLINQVIPEHTVSGTILQLPPRPTVLLLLAVQA